ncbi:histidine phosphatase family protein [Hymenobacter sp. BT770]|uniref:SixA phosphatase family protein n=1 Tax=Hymenobacter sp. BT770 TaxID=2886942 RepID=UPI001D0FABC5|nr:histidine phosphatase family protein [Hymenobacter sp. BT770]MCC3153281.1 histidine phosphatase family protein [Hymenobacter sp. BT770]MDO3414276.1 histidine phosphatase family protein [Hymenobacter sp. BT770]
MKTLYLLRHAKSSWSFNELSDQERPLNDRGRDDAPAMGKALAKRHIRPDLVVSSPAVRAMSTAVLVAREMEYPHDKIVVEPGIYGADVDGLLDVIHNLPDTAGSVLLVGHNPTITETANALSPSSLNEMPTAAVVCLRFDCDHWADVSKANAEFYFYDYPRNVK